MPVWLQPRQVSWTVVRHGKSLDRDALKKELGDVLWYLTDFVKGGGVRRECPECHGPCKGFDCPERVL